jgi:hypothetical protein
MRCDDVLALVTDAWDGVADPLVARGIEGHARGCPACRTYASQLRLVAEALREAERLEVTPLPPALEARLLGLARWHCRTRRADGPGPVPLGIGSDFVTPGDHLACFWQDDAEFDAGVGFLAAGLEADDHCVVFGHEQANARVLSSLERREHDADRLVGTRRISVVGGAPTGEGLMAATGRAVQSAIDGGAPLVRLLGNLGWGHAGWPADAEILAFEAKVTEVARTLPLVVTCMYDVNALPGRLVLQGGFETHPLTHRRRALRRNDLCVAA